MKAIIYIFITLIIVSLPLVWLDKTSHTNTTEITVIRDLTDKFTATPKVEEITPLYNFNNNIWDGGIFRLINITDVDLNKVSQVNIGAENFLLGNKFKRKEKVKTFYAGINKIISFENTEAIGKDNSAVYFPIAKELNRLSQSKATTRVLLIYSDLCENTPEMSFYDSDKFELLKTKPDKIQQYFDSQIKLANLNGIKIYLIYQPQNIKQDEQYRVVSNFYKTLFQSKGATVEITASMN